jgi:hypothetical protein
MDTSDMLLHATTDITLPQGNYVPRIIGKVNGIATHPILDTGCTPRVINFHKVLKLGLANQLVHNAQNQKGGMMVGDGRRVSCTGLIQGLEIEILPEHSIKVDALVLDVPEIAYEFLFGRIAMAKIGIHADLGKSRWFVSDGSSDKPLEVFYTDPYATNDKCEPSSCYIVNVDPDSSNVEKTITIPDEEKFKKLFDQIQNNDLLSFN